MNTLIQTLPEGPLDIVGDIHGEFDAFRQLLHHLGYNEHGRHPEGRTLVLVGDVCDRGPDSPAMLHWLTDGVQNGVVRAVLGNHELNLLGQDPKDGAGWYFPEQRERDSPWYEPYRKATPRERAAFFDFLNTLPVVLLRDDIRIVHAAWLPESLEAVAKLPPKPTSELYRQFELHVKSTVRQSPFYEDYQREQETYAQALHDSSAAMSMLPATQQYDLLRSRHNPLRALMCGVETAADTPFFVSGSWRFTQRLRWWEDYADNVAVVFGHYWRRWQSLENQKPDLFAPAAPTAWLGRRGSAFCVDFSIGARWQDRRNGIAPADSCFHLAALRWPERTLMLETGQSFATTGFQAA